MKSINLSILDFKDVVDLRLHTVTINLSILDFK